LEADTLAVRVEEYADALEVPLARVTKLEVHRGQKSRAGGGAVIGASIGAAAGVITAYALCSDGCVSLYGGVGAGGETNSDTVIFGVGGALVGAGIGALFGAAIHTDRWEETRWTISTSARRR
jgi:hypothetical protein